MKRSNSKDSGAGFSINMKAALNILDVDTSKIRLGKVVKGQYGKTIGITYEDKPLKFTIGLPPSTVIHKFNEATYDFKIGSTWGIGMFTNDKEKKEGADPKVSFSLGLDLFEGETPSEYHNEVVKKLDEIREAVCKLLQPNPELFDRIDDVELSVVRERVGCIYDFPKVQVREQKVSNTKSLKRTLRGKIMFFAPKPSEELSAKCFKTKLYDCNLINEKKKRGARGASAAEAVMPVNSNMELMYNMPLKIFVACVDLSGLFVMSTGAFFWKKNIDSVFFVSGSDTSFEILDDEEPAEFDF